MADIAVLITTYNRKKTTLRCLEMLYKIGYEIDVYLVDDLSPDGTANQVRNKFPMVEVIEGTGDLFWARGMHLAWGHALKIGYKFYLWLNDDVELNNNCLSELLECSRLKNNKAIISGIIEDSATGETIYGGFDIKNRLLEGNGFLQKISHMHGNAVLVPQNVYEKIGQMDSNFHHDLADVDYGLTALKANIEVLTTRCSIGVGNANEFCRVRKYGVSLSERFKTLYSPLGSHPKIIYYFRKKHYGKVNAVLYIIHLYIINILSDYIIGLVFGKRYM